MIGPPRSKSSARICCTYQQIRSAERSGVLLISLRLIILKKEETLAVGASAPPLEPAFFGGGGVRGLLFWTSFKDYSGKRQRGLRTG